MNIVFWIIVLTVMFLIWALLARFFIKLGQFISYIETNIANIMTKREVEIQDE